MKYPLKIKTPPVEEALSVAEAKEFFREDRSVEDTLIGQLVTSARRSLERHTGFHMVDTVYEMYLDGFTDIKIPKRPYKSESISIAYIDENGDEQALSDSLYKVHEVDVPAEVEFTGDLPALSAAERYPVIITFTAGYGESTDDVPAEWKSVIGLIAMVFWKRDIPKDSFEDFNPLNLRVVRAQIQDHMIGRFK